MEEQSKQAIFDKTVRHLAKQGKRAMRPDAVCMYRTEDGCSCAVGCHFTDEEYSTDLEGVSIDGLIIDCLLPERLVQHRGLLRELQVWHDSPCTPTQTLSDIAFLFNLSDAVVIELADKLEAFDRSIPDTYLTAA